MRVPRKLINDTKDLIKAYSSKKLIHYRNLHQDIDLTDFHIGTKADFRKIVKKNKGILKLWKQIKDENKVKLFYESKSGSQYLVNDKDEVFRLSDHWGAVAGCEWTLEGEGDLRTNVFETGDLTIGITTFSEMIPFQRKISPRKDYVVNPEWKEQLKYVKRAAERLQRLKDRRAEFKALSNEDKHFIGANCGNFRHEIKLAKTTRRLKI